MGDNPYAPVYEPVARPGGHTGIPIGRFGSRMVCETCGDISVADFVERGWVGGPIPGDPDYAHFYPFEGGDIPDTPAQETARAARDAWRRENGLAGYRNADPDTIAHRDRRREYDKANAKRRALQDAPSAPQKAQDGS